MTRCDAHRQRPSRPPAKRFRHPVVCAGLIHASCNSSTASRAYDRWKAPAEDGATLIWPAVDQLLRDTRDNHHRSSAAHTSSSRTSRFRSSHLHAAMAWPSRCRTSRIIATGHQAELHHPGVWAKNALIDATAERLGGRAYSLSRSIPMSPSTCNLRLPGGAMPLLDDAEHPMPSWSGAAAGSDADASGGDRARFRRGGGAMGFPADGRPIPGRHAPLAHSNRPAWPAH